VTRREFLLVPPAAALAAPAKPVDITWISAISDELARSPADAIAFAKQYGLKWLELRTVPGARKSYIDLTDEELKAAKKELADNGIGVSHLAAPLLKITLPGTSPVRRTPESPEAKKKREERDAAAFNRRMEDLKKAANAAHILGTDKIRVFAFSRVEDPLAILPRVAEALEPMVEYAGRQKMYLVLENEGSCNVATCAEMAALAKLLPSKWFGLNWDTLNGGSREVAFPDGYNLLPKHRILNVHIKGRAVLDGPQKQDWAAIFRTMVQDGYRHKFGLETHIDIGGPGQIPASHEAMKAIHAILQQL
jgi:sugar phosphate isomerase/epimerase